MKEFIITNFDPIMRWGGFLVTMILFVWLNGKSYDYVWRNAFVDTDGKPVSPRPLNEAAYRKAFGLPAKKPQLTVIRGGKP